MTEEMKKQKKSKVNSLAASDKRTFLRQIAPSPSPQHNLNSSSLTREELSTLIKHASKEKKSQEIDSTGELYDPFRDAFQKIDSLIMTAMNSPEGISETLLPMALEQSQQILAQKQDRTVPAAVANHYAQKQGIYQLAQAYYYGRRATLQQYQYEMELKDKEKKKEHESLIALFKTQFIPQYRSIEEDLVSENKFRKNIIMRILDQFKLRKKEKNAKLLSERDEFKILDAIKLDLIRAKKWYEKVKSGEGFKGITNELRADAMYGISIKTISDFIARNYDAPNSRYQQLLVRITREDKLKDKKKKKKEKNKNKKEEKEKVLTADLSPDETEDASSEDKGETEEEIKEDYEIKEQRTDNEVKDGNQVLKSDAHSSEPSEVSYAASNNQTSLQQISPSPQYNLNLYNLKQEELSTLIAQASKEKKSIGVNSTEGFFDPFRTGYDQIENLIITAMNSPLGISEELLLRVIAQSQQILTQTQDRELSVIMEKFYAQRQGIYQLALAFYYAKRATLKLSQYEMTLQDREKKKECASLIEVFSDQYIPLYNSMISQGDDFERNNALRKSIFMHIKKQFKLQKKEKKALLSERGEYELLDAIRLDLEKSKEWYEKVAKNTGIAEIMNVEFAYRTYGLPIKEISYFYSKHYELDDSRYQQLLVSVTREDKRKQKERDKKKRKKDKDIGNGKEEGKGNGKIGKDDDQEIKQDETYNNEIHEIKEEKTDNTVEEDNQALKTGTPPSEQASAVLSSRDKKKIKRIQKRKQMQEQMRKQNNKHIQHQNNKQKSKQQIQEEEPSALLEENSEKKEEKEIKSIGIHFEEKSPDLFIQSFKKIDDLLVERMESLVGITETFLVQRIADSQNLLAGRDDFKMSNLLVNYYVQKGAVYQLALAYYHAQAASSYLSQYAANLQDEDKKNECSLLILQLADQFIPIAKNIGDENKSHMLEDGFRRRVFLHIKTKAQEQKKGKKHLSAESNAFELLDKIKVSLTESKEWYEKVKNNAAFNEGEIDMTCRASIASISAFIGENFDRSGCHYLQLLAESKIELKVSSPISHQHNLGLFARRPCHIEEKSVLTRTEMQSLESHETHSFVSSSEETSSQGEFMSSSKMVKRVLKEHQSIQLTTESKNSDPFSDTFEQLDYILTDGVHSPEGVTEDLLLLATQESNRALAEHKDSQVSGIIRYHYEHKEVVYLLALAFYYAGRASRLLLQYSATRKENQARSYELFVSQFEQQIFPLYGEGINRDSKAFSEKHNNFMRNLLSHLKKQIKPLKSEQKDLSDPKNEVELLGLIRADFMRAKEVYERIQNNAGYNEKITSPNKGPYYEGFIQVISLFVQSNFDDRNGRYQQLLSQIAREGKNKKKQKDKRNKRKERKKNTEAAGSHSEDKGNTVEEEKKEEKSGNQIEGGNQALTTVELFSENETLALEDKKANNNALVQDKYQEIRAAENKTDNSNQDLVSEEPFTDTAVLPVTSPIERKVSALSLRQNQSGFFSLKPRLEEMFVLTRKEREDLESHAKHSLFDVARHYLVWCISVSRAFKLPIPGLGLESDILKLSQICMSHNERLISHLRENTKKRGQNKNFGPTSAGYLSGTGFEYDEKEIEGMCNCFVLLPIRDSMTAIYWLTIASEFHLFPHEVMTCITSPEIALFLKWKIGVNAFERLKNEIVPEFVSDLNNQGHAKDHPKGYSGWFCVVKAIFSKSDQVEEEEFTTRINKLGLPKTKFWEHFLARFYEEEMQQRISYYM